MAETFKAARERIIHELAAEHHWKVVTMNPSLKPMKVPHATSQGGDMRLWFKPQAVHVSYGKFHSLNSARSLWVDIRGLDVNALIAQVERFK